MRGYNQQQQQPSSNFDRFLKNTTPVVVPARYYSRSFMDTWGNCFDVIRPYFILGDLWESFREWSAYGAEVPLTMNGGDSVVQYYYPTLSAIQLYVAPSRRITQQCNPCGQLVFEYYESKLPFERETLVDQMAILASGFPELRTYLSCDLTDSSWISVAWYPIYRIPVGQTLPVAQTIQNADARFLAFHSLARPCDHGRSKLTLPTFGLVTKKFEVSKWDKDVYAGHKISSLLQEAENWLWQLQLDYCDKNYFLESHNTNSR